MRNRTGLEEAGVNNFTTTIRNTSDANSIWHITITIFDSY